MGDVTVATLAAEIGIPPEKLLEQLINAGVNVSGIHDVVTLDDKRTLLSYVRGGYTGPAEPSPSRGTLLTRLRDIMEFGKLVCVNCGKDFTPAIVRADPAKFRWNCRKFFNGPKEYQRDPERGFKVIWPRASPMARKQFLVGACSNQCWSRLCRGIRDPL